MLWYIILFNLPVLCIILYLFTHDKKNTHYQPVHFEKKPRSSCCESVSYSQSHPL